MAFNAADLEFTDPLTGLGNHRRFHDKIDRLISERADDPAPFAVGLLDLDGFKPINDLFGRAAGDFILQQVALRLNAAMDDSATVARVGADEFAFLYPMVFSEEAISQKARMLIEILSAPYDIGERTARLSASVGGSLFYSGDETTSHLLNKAETALYHAKRSGRSGVVVYTPAQGFSGTDRFSYTAVDGKGGSSTSTVIVVVSTTSTGIAVVSHRHRRRRPARR